MSASKFVLPAAFAHHYEKLGIADPALRDQLEIAAGNISDLGRRTTEQSFLLGEHLVAASGLLADGLFDKWVKRRCSLAARTARAYMSVARNLGEYRDDLVDLSASPTVMFHLAHAPHDKIRDAIAHGEEHGRLRVLDVKTILGDGDEGKGKTARGDLHGAGGVTGLKALIAVKTRDGLKMFVTHIEVIVQAIKSALDQKRVIKEALAREVEDLARVARMELESLAQFVEPDSDLRRHPRSTQFPNKTEWAVVNETLQKLGLFDIWPKSKELPGWLRDEVLPVLEWAISKERKPKWPLAQSVGKMVAVDDVVELTPEAEAEQDKEQAEASVETDLDRFTERFGKALERATGGLMVVSRQTPKVRKQVVAVPPLAADEAADGLNETLQDEVASAPAVTA